MAIIKTEDLTYVYSAGTPFEKKAIDNLNIEIEEGELVGIIGHTGSGKSTFIQHLNGLLKPTSGKIYIDGTETENISSKIGYMLQKDSLLEWRTIYNNVMIGLEIRKIKQ
ncbi:MAG: ATP-binding cassette domain-containing protein, partial [Oscillospiraceae bacterium]|nr:ATP-binding cassette domain-containing protein [Oscillospiraceae bacterium]